MSKGLLYRLIILGYNLSSTFDITIRIGSSRWAHYMHLIVFVFCTVYAQEAKKDLLYR